MVDKWDVIESCNGSLYTHTHTRVYVWICVISLIYMCELSIYVGMFTGVYVLACYIKKRKEQVIVVWKINLPVIKNDML